MWCILLYVRRQRGSGTAGSSSSAAAPPVAGAAQLPYGLLTGVAVEFLSIFSTLLMPEGAEDEYGLVQCIKHFGCAHV